MIEGLLKIEDGFFFIEKSSDWSMLVRNLSLFRIYLKIFQII